MIMKLVIILLLLMKLSISSKILVIFPVPARSHGILGESISKTLQDVGHEVTYISAVLNKEVPGIKWINISSMLLDPLGPKPPSVQELTLNPRPMYRLHFLGPTVNKKVLQHPDVQMLLTDPTITFDAIIIQWIFSGLLAPIGTLYKCPVIWYSANEPHWLVMRMIDEHTNAAYTVDLQSHYAPKIPFGFYDRAYQLWLQMYQTVLQYYVKYFMEIPAYKEIYGSIFDKKGLSLPDYDEVVYNGSLMLINSYPPLSEPLTLPQNAKYVGGHHIEYPLKPLPENLQKLLDDAETGVIFFSLGSSLKSKDFPEETKIELVRLFGELNQTVLWKFEANLPNMPKNVHILDWAPQTSILNHPNTVLFISHGGMLSLTETTQAGVPVIGIPFFGDQFVNVDRAVSRGCALRVDLNTHFARNLRASVFDILSNASYQQKAREASQIFKYRVSPARWELSYWVQYILDTNGAPHLRSPALVVPWYQRSHLDIIILFVITLWMVLKVFNSIYKGSFKSITTNKFKKA